MAEFAAQRFNVERAFTDCKVMLTETAPDVLHILTPPQTHFDIVTNGLLAGAHVIVEKPVAPSYEEFEKLWKLSQETGRHLIEDHNYRFNPEIRKLERLDEERVASRRLFLVLEQSDVPGALAGGDRSPEDGRFELVRAVRATLSPKTQLQRPQANQKTYANSRIGCDNSAPEYSRR